MIEAYGEQGFVVFRTGAQQYDCSLVTLGRSLYGLMEFLLASEYMDRVGRALTRCSVLLKRDLGGIAPSLSVSVLLLTV